LLHFHIQTTSAYLFASAIAISLAMFVIDFFKSLRRFEAQALTPYRGSSAGLATDHYLG